MPRVCRGRDGSVLLSRYFRARNAPEEEEVTRDTHPGALPRESRMFLRGLKEYCGEPGHVTDVSTRHAVPCRLTGAAEEGNRTWHVPFGWIVCSCSDTTFVSPTHCIAGAQGLPGPGFPMCIWLTSFFQRGAIVFSIPVDHREKDPTCTRAHRAQRQLPMILDNAFSTQARLVTP